MKERFNGISFVVPAFNEQEYIEKTIKSIQSIGDSFNIPFEIIVVDNGSTDNTASIVEEYNCQLIKINKAKVSFARNIGAKNASFNLYAFIDGDTVLANGWGHEIVSFMASYGPEDRILTGCPVSVPPEPTWIESAWFDSVSKNYIGGANIICTKSLFDDVNGFDETLETGEDYDFCRKAKRSNFLFVINENFKAIHLGYPSKILDFARREIWHGKGDCKDFNTFFTSKVSLVALLYIILIIVALSLFFHGHFFASLLPFGLLLLLNFGLTLKRFGLLAFDKMVFNYFLNFIYFICRNISILSVVKDKFR